MMSPIEGAVRFARIDPSGLKPRQKEHYNFCKVSAVLADFGYATIRLSDDWQGADFIAQHIDGKTFLKVQLKARAVLHEGYVDKDLYVAFPDGTKWYLYPHDALLSHALKDTTIGNTESWRSNRSYSFPKLSGWLRDWLRPYEIGSPADNPNPLPLDEGPDAGPEV